MVQLRGSSTVCVNAHEDGYIEKVNGEYRNVAYLQNRMHPISRDRIIGMAASFVCLQAAARDNQNRFSLLYY